MVIVVRQLPTCVSGIYTFLQESAIHTTLLLRYSYIQPRELPSLHVITNK
jgi:hypothetical protein